MALRLLKVPSLATAVLASSGFYLYNRRLDFNDLSLIRFGRAAATTAVISYDYLTAFKHVEYGTEEYRALKSKVHRRSAERLRDLCCANRGTFIKVGQHLGALDYLLPEEYTSTLKVLHSRAPQSSMEEIVQVIREDFGKELSELFVLFEETPQGAASLAQVHKAVLHDGRTVAVKVQHPKVQRQSSKDILVMEVLLRGVHWLFPDFAFMWLVEEAKKNMPLELNFLNEGHNSEIVSKKLAHFTFLKVPMIHWDLSTKRVLTMEFAEGGQVNDREYMKTHGINVNEISENLGKMYSEMIFIHGFVHCDPHPGNVLVRKCQKSKKTEIILLDHGLYQVLQPDFRINYCQLWQALIHQDMSGVEHYSRKLGAGDLYPLFACVLTARSWAAINSGISSVPVTLSEDVEIRTNAAVYLPQINDLLNKVPRQMLLLLKTNDLLRGIETTLQTRASSSSFINMSRCCIRALARHKRSKIQSSRRRLQITLTESFNLWRLSMYELFLWLKGSLLGQGVSTLLAFLH
ncbi:aarF domain-containing protein kinase 1 isoform X1 [Phyllopteryx taeniolatus]|uniref:aarF domain-containing protein kinase 1 isoform X1 n=1 Tax=Phyllopteryx taeniolatus TaxID=161469 RepID=UPI002AD576BD|nr:aarF domain-containing protein kinase 1 isoform X1 [Phyllopteryx taeniolatus]XP_061651524.1 aarF domain-containing protein kinase 1 isoform X1 [Phyllopteryx taeniolatus]XP_061651525.1 aarF domain-containing protein kinase 1 isoform X1 [Phyllopteryx taeniolatus]XP_061651526.1 aarF domain-containing protein kinase 1 isoform X1 [Phyllopteryx taeniolatus]